MDLKLIYSFNHCFCFLKTVPPTDPFVFNYPRYNCHLYLVVIAVSLSLWTAALWGIYYKDPLRMLVSGCWNWNTVFHFHNVYRTPDGICSWKWHSESNWQVILKSSYSIQFSTNVVSQRHLCTKMSSLNFCHWHVDHSCALLCVGEGFFIHCSTASGKKGDGAKMQSGRMNPKRQLQCLQFFYFHSGSDQDQLNIWIREYDRENKEATYLMGQIIGGVHIYFYPLNFSHTKVNDSLHKTNHLKVVMSYT